MTFNEFKAWLDGYREGKKGGPTEAQWKLIQKRLNEVEPDEVVEGVERYTPYRPWWPMWYSTSIPYSGTTTVGNTGGKISTNWTSCAYQIG